MLVNFIIEQRKENNKIGFKILLLKFKSVRSKLSKNYGTNFYHLKRITYKN